MTGSGWVEFPGGCEECSRPAYTPAQSVSHWLPDQTVVLVVQQQIQIWFSIDLLGKHSSWQQLTWTHRIIGSIWRVTRCATGSHISFWTGRVSPSQVGNVIITPCYWKNRHVSLFVRPFHWCLLNWSFFSQYENENTKTDLMNGNFKMDNCHKESNFQR